MAGKRSVRPGGGLRAKGIGATAREALSQQARNFLSSSSLHGVRYIAQSDRPLIERAAWLALVAAGAAVAAAIIASLWDKFQTSPTIMGLDTDFHNWDVAFPAVSLCPVDPSDPAKVSAFLSEEMPGEEVTEDSISFVKSFTELSLSTLHGFGYSATRIRHPPNHLLPHNISLRVSWRPEEFLSKCTWVGEDEFCPSMFLPALTEVGLCYCFNAKHSFAVSPWNSSIIARPGPRKIYETDVKWTISFDMNSPPWPMRVYIHSSDILPGAGMSPQHFWDGSITTVLFSAKETYTTDDARQLTIRQRRCVFHDEITPPTGGSYSYWACDLACRRAQQRKACGCAPYFQPLDGLPICNISGLLCLSSVAKEVLETECPCELGCSNTVYEVEKLVEAQEMNLTTLEIGFESWPMIKYKREVLFGWVDLLVSFGGIAGLFLGFSLLSAVELIYYFTLRSCCSVIHHKREGNREELVVTQNAHTSKSSLMVLSAKQLEARILNQARRHQGRQMASYATYPAYTTNTLLPYLE